MKLSNIVVTASLIAPASAFAPLSIIRPNLLSSSSYSGIQFMSATAEEQDLVTESSMPNSDPYERMGITKDQLAIGVDASEFLQWIGT
jgi:hypothetical protein